MTIDTFTTSKDGARRQDVDKNGAAYMVEAPYPPIGVAGGMRVFRKHLTDDGLVTDGTNQAMDVDGSSTNVDFYIESDDDEDIYICMVSFVIADASQTLGEFANTNNPLTNGCRFFYSDTIGEVDIHEALKTNFDFVRLCGGQPAFGDAAGAFLANNITGTSEGYIPTLDIRATFGFKWGLRLARGARQRLTMRIRDNCTAADQFDAICYGFKHNPA